MRKLAEELQSAGVPIWIDEAELNIGDSLITKISNAIFNTDFLGAILSHNSVASSWVQLELEQAMTQEIKGRKVKVLPILIEKCEIPVFLAHKIYADFTDPNKYNETFLKLLTALGASKPPVLTYSQLNTNISLSQSVRTPNPSSFVDHSINGVDKARTYKPDPKLEMFNVYLNLTHKPTREWVQIFDAERRFPRHNMWRKAWIDGQHIVINCTLEEINKYHLRDLKEDLVNANKKYREYLQQEVIKQQTETEKKSAEQKNIDNILDNLEI